MCFTTDEEKIGNYSVFNITQFSSTSDHFKSRHFFTPLEYHTTCSRSGWHTWFSKQPTNTFHLKMRDPTTLAHAIFRVIGSNTSLLISDPELDPIIWSKIVLKYGTPDNDLTRLESKICWFQNTYNVRVLCIVHINKNKVLNYI